MPLAARRARLLLAGGVALFTPVHSPLRAQRASRGQPAASHNEALVRPERSGIAGTGLTTADAAGRDAPTVTPAVSVSAAPGSFSVVVVRVPEPFASRQSIDFEITPAPAVSILSPLSGTVASVGGAARQDAARQVFLTLGLPRRVRAGVLTLATVRFRSERDVIETAVHVTVSRTRQVELTALQVPSAVAAGTRYRLAYRLTNMGNGLDTLSMRIEAPKGWQSLEPSGSPSVVLDVHAAFDAVALFSVPAGASGSATLHLTVLAGGDSATAADVAVNVVSPRTEALVAGPSLTLGSALAYGPWGSVASLSVARLEGALTDRVSVAGRASWLGPGADGASYAFSRAGIFSAPPSIRLSAREWRLALGETAESCSDICGVDITGTGASVSINRPTWGATALAARPGAGRDSGGGEFGVLRMEAKMKRISFSSAWSHLSDNEDESRRLDAVSLGTSVSDLFGGRWLGEVAQRRFAGGEALGWSTRYSRRSRSGHADISYAHAPGGSLAFARATNAVSASASRSLSRNWSVNGGAWNSTDAGGVDLDRLSVSGWSIGSSTLLADNLGLTFAGRGSDFTARSAVGIFGNGDRSAEAAVDLRAGMLGLAAVATGSRLTRRTAISSGELITQSAPRGSLRTTLGVAGSSASLAFTGAMERGGAGMGLPTQQWSYGVRLDRVTLWTHGSTRISAAADAQRFSGLIDGRGPAAVSASLTAALPQGLSVDLTAERNPFIFAEAGARRTMLVLGVSRATSMRRLSHAESRGVVFRDLNGNGLRDRGEQGLPGVVLQRGSEVETTDDEGWFTFDGEARHPIYIDARSLPVGWIAQSTIVNPDRREVAVLKLSAVEIRLRVVDADASRVSDDDLRRVAVFARDEGGRVWMARRGDANSAVFDALPPGTYSLQLDASASREPLFVDESVASIIVPGTKSNDPVIIMLRARAMKFRAPLRPSA